MTAKRRTTKKATNRAAPKRRGRPPKIPTADQIKRVEELAGLGLSVRAIAAAIGIDRNTFAKYQEKYFSEAMERGAALSEERVARRLYAEAGQGNMTAIIWIEKTRSGRSDRVQQLHTDPDGNPLAVGVPGTVAIFLPPNGRDVPVPGQEIPAAFTQIGKPPRPR